MKGKTTYLMKAAVLLIVALFSLTGTRAETLTVYDGTNTSQTTPVYLSQLSRRTKSQIILPATQLSAMKGGLITAIKFYTSANTAYTSPNVNVYVKEVTNTSFASTSFETGGTTVYTGTLSFANREVSITFSTPVVYNGDNLLIGVDNTATGTNSTLSFYGLTQGNGSNVALYGNRNNSAPTTGTRGRFLPKTTFTYLLPPTNLAVSDITTTSAVLGWRDNANAKEWIVAYKAEGEADFTEGSTEGNPFTLEGLTQDTKYTVKVASVVDRNELWSDEFTFSTAVAYPRPTNVVASDVLSGSATITWSGEADSYNLRYATATGGGAFVEDFENGLDAQGWTTIRNGGGADATDWRTYDPSNFSSPLPTHSGNYIAMSRSWSGSAYSVDNWLISPIVDLGGTMTYWVMDDGEYHEHYDIYVSTTTTAISAFTKVYEPGNASASWTMVTVDLSSFAGQRGYVAFRHTDTDQDYLFIDDVTISAPTSVSGSWTTVNNVTSPYVLQGLNPETTYAVEVQAVYSGNQSNWAGTTLTTLPSNPIPFDVEVAVSHTSATIDWSGDSDSYEVKYRTAYDDGATYFQDFENSVEGWTIYTEGGHMDGYEGWVWADGFGENESSALVAFSWYDESYNADNWLISPALELDGTLKFYTNTDEADGVPDSYEVLLSTTGTNISDFNITLKSLAAASTGTVSIDLSQYAGLTGYIAIHHVCEDMFFLAIDNFGIYGDETPAGEWITVTTTDTSVELTGLEIGTEYEYIITGIQGGVRNDGTTPAFFTTLTLDNKIFVTDGDWDVAENWYPVGVPTEDCLSAEIQANVTIPAGVVAYAEEVTVNGGSITIQEGGQLIHYNEGVIATVEKEIQGYGDAVAGGYYLITPPVSIGIWPEDVEGMLEGDYDLYAFDFTQDGQEWRNYKAEEFPLFQGEAYLYANKEDVTLRFTGELMPFPSTGTVGFASGYYAAYTTDAHPFANWNLGGNSYATDTYMTLGDYSTAGLYIADHQYFYSMNDDGDAIIAGSQEVITAPTEGVFFVSQAETSLLLGAERSYADNEATNDDVMPILPFHGLDTNQDASPNYTLANNEDNTAVIEYLDGKTGNIKLADRTLYKDGGWNTICLPFNLTLTGSTLDGADVRALNSASVDGSTLVLNFSSEGAVSELTAGTPYIIKWTSGDNIVEPAFTGVTISSETNDVACDLGNDMAVTFKGTYGFQAFTDVDKSILFMGSSNKLYYPGNGAEIGAQRAYFQLEGLTISTSQEVSGIKQFVVSFEDDATGINDLDAIANRNEAIYNIVGQRVNKMQQGIYINNGKKTLVK